MVWAHVDLNGDRIANNKFGKFVLEIPYGRHTGGLPTPTLCLKK